MPKKNAPAKAGKPSGQQKNSATTTSGTAALPLGMNNLSLAGPAGVAAVPANVNVVFTSGVGQLTASLFRNGMLINMQSVGASGAIFFSDVQSNDVISINGVCTGNASVAVTVPTVPATPQTFPAGPIHVGLIVS